MKKCEKKFITFLYIFTLMLAKISYAAEQLSEAQGNLKDGNGVYATLREIIGILLLIGVGISIIKMMHIGIKYLTQPAGGRSNAKESIIPWFVGAVVLALFWQISNWVIGELEPTNSGSIFDI